MKIISLIVPCNIYSKTRGERFNAYVGVGESLVEGGRVEEQPLQDDGALPSVLRVQRVVFAVLLNQVGDDGAAATTSSGGAVRGGRRARRTRARVVGAYLASQPGRRGRRVWRRVASLRFAFHRRAVVVGARPTKRDATVRSTRRHVRTSRRYASTNSRIRTAIKGRRRLTFPKWRNRRRPTSGSCAAG